MDIIIDCYIKGHQEGLSALRRKKGVLAASFGGVYREDKDYCQIHVTTDNVSADNIESWAWGRKWKNFKLVGAVEKS